MSSQIVYQHKKFAAKAEDYTHKKFGKHTNKRKHDELDEKENVSPITAQTILDLKAQEVNQMEKPLPKWKQTKALFRPWLEESDKKKEHTSTPLNATNNNILPQQHNATLEQQKRRRNHLDHRNHQQQQLAQQLRLQQLQQYNVYQYYQAAVMQQNLYLRHLQQLALQRQGQLFVFGQQ
ncbi:hypothetical protein FF38_02534 [Lucilia cuprina]|uniref:Uncharacterized protein n=1 Tax=Lucilia cuprina TaxID=7375 RepID=A0A0L0C1I6_LUCCU|nr:hypothetical protein CVS40_7657 [Lucilia cuprina]KNC25294.1 hypothetical protein FF38_02534 [Lucilia cuprina]